MPMLMLPLSVAAMLPAIVFPSVARRSRRPATCHPDMPNAIPIPVARNPKRIGERKRRAHFFDRRWRRCFNDLRAARRRRRLVHRARIRRISGPPVALVEKPNASPVLPRRWLPDIPRCRRQGPMSLYPDLPARMPCPIACDPLMTEGWRLGHHFQSQSRRRNGDSHSGYEVLRKSGERTHQHCKEDELLHERSADGEVIRER